MKPQPHALTPAALAAAAGRKTQKVQRKLKAAEAELHNTNQVLVKALPDGAKRDVAVALKHNLDAEEKVREATEELEAVTELLSHGEGLTPETAVTAAKGHAPNGKSGQGAHSVIEHLPKRGG